MMMRNAWIVVLVGLVIVGAGTYFTQGGEVGGSSSKEGATASAQLRTAADEVLGSVKLKQRGDVVEVSVKVEGSVTPGFHGFHIHTAGVCVAPFTSAGGHYNPAGLSHSDHAGDLP